MKINLEDIDFIQKIKKDIYISPLCLKDDTFLYKQIRQNYHYLLPWCPWIEDLKSLQDVRSFLIYYTQQLEQNKYFRLGIYHQGKIIGWVSAFDFDWKEKSYYLGYWIASKYQKRGYVIYTVRFMMSLLLKIFKLNTTYILCRKHNFPSRSLVSRLKAKEIPFYTADVIAYKITL